VSLLVYLDRSLMFMVPSLFKACFVRSNYFMGLGFYSFIMYSSFNASIETGATDGN